jgi:homocysteine S-methyltransferase
VGPYGAYLHDGSEYNGYYTDRTPSEVLKNYHKSKIGALVEAGVDLLAIETIPSKKEAEIIVEIIKEFPNIKAWLSFSCQV